jgi:hypothetical protein
MATWITQDTVLDTLDQRPHNDARWMIQQQSSVEGESCNVQLWTDTHEHIVQFRDLWVRNSGQDVEIHDMGAI